MCHSPNLGISRFPYAVTRTSVYSRPGITCCYTSQHVRVRTMQQVCHSPNLSISRYPYAVTRSSMYAYAPCSRCVIPQTSAYPGIHMPLHEPACTRTHHAAGNAHQVESVEGAAQEYHREKGSKQHLRATHHLQGHGHRTMCQQQA